jgi:acyl-CoA thioester hydrolase
LYGDAVESPEYRQDIVAAREDEDEVGHVSNIVYLRWVLEVARAHSDAVGWDHAAYVRLGSVWVVRKHELEYLRPVRAGDAVALVTWVDSWRGASSVRKTSIRSPEGVELARASTLWAFVSLGDGRPLRIPEHLKRDFAGTP